MITPRQPIAKPHIIVDDNSYTIVATGKTVTTTHYGTPLAGDALAQAIRLHGFPGVCVEVHGNQYKGMEYNGPNRNYTHTVTWATGPVKDVTIIGGPINRAAKIGTVTVHNGAGDLRIQNATVQNHSSGYSPFLVAMNGIAGCMRLYEVNIEPQDPNAWGGKGMKWGIRGHGCAQWDIRNINFAPAVEHNMYLDNCQGTSYFVNCKGGNTGRTMFQITNRKVSGPTAFGDIIVKGCESRNVWSQGGSDFTFAGIGEGTIYFMDNKSYGSTNGSHGAFVCWSDAGHGLYLNENGYTTGGLVIRNFIVDHPNADRDHIAIAGVEHAILANWQVKGNRTALLLNSKYGGKIDNGYVGLYTRDGSLPSQSAGWQASNKVGKYNFVTQQTKIFTNAEIDAMQYTR